MQTICEICSSKAEHAFSATVLNKHSANFYCCQECGFLFANDPFWLEEAYSSPIAAADTGLIARNIDISRKLACVLFLCGQNSSSDRYLDIAGGYGMLTRLMRDVGYDFYWFDRYCENIFAKNFEFSKGLSDCRAVTAIEVLEHVSNPVGFIAESLSLAGSEMLIFTTELFEGVPPNPGAWWYYTFETGQHISFYQKRTLAAIAKRLGLNLVSSRGLHILSRRKVNEKLLRWVTHPVVARLGEVWVRRRLDSKTVPDHKLILSLAQHMDSAQ